MKIVVDEGNFHSVVRFLGSNDDELRELGEDEISDFLKQRLLKTFGDMSDVEAFDKLHTAFFICKGVAVFLNDQWLDLKPGAFGVSLCVYVNDGGGGETVLSAEPEPVGS
ncbi:hypothetical protein [Amorphus sp. 3PC139-8]|uniref:hypothetical protein n=1 Tax=Amorphus sp. 3PC139-8 TaxID=2735676 RepID=UPI00345DA5A4